MSRRVPVKIGEELIGRFRAAVETDPSYTQRDHSRWVSEALEMLAGYSAEKLAKMQLHTGDAMDVLKPVYTEFAFADEQLSTLKALLLTLRTTEPTVAWTQALIIRAAIRYRLNPDKYADRLSRQKSG